VRAGGTPASHLLVVILPDWNAAAVVAEDEGEESFGLFDMMDQSQQVPGFFDEPDAFDFWW